MKSDKVIQAIRYAKSILSGIGLSDWSVWSNNSYSVIGKAEFDRKRMVFSKRYIMKATKEEFRKVVLHEAAHVIAGYDAGHGEEFVKVCRHISPDEPYDSHCITASIHKYNITCPQCGDIGQTNKNTPLYCEPCATSGRGVFEYARTNNDPGFTEWASTP